MSQFDLFTPRNNKRNIKEILNTVYGDLDFSDILDFDPNNNVVIGAITLDKPKPILRLLIEKPHFYQLIKSLGSDSIVLLNLKELTLKDNKKSIELSNEVKEEIKETIKELSCYGGYLDKDGSHIIDLKGEKIGPHFNINLLLGNREKLSEPLLTTPKSVVDEFGGGSFRGPAAHQVLATRWDMDPSENGNPFNRQFYLLENGKQIFYSHNAHENVLDAKCVHKVNRTEIEYHLNNDLSIFRTIYLKPQNDEDEPIALERQIVEIQNSSNNERHLDIVFTGMFGSANPGCQMVDVIYQSVINQSGIIYKDNKVVGITPDYYPSYAREYKRFFSLSGEIVDEFSYDVNDFIGNGSINHPEHLSYLGNKMMNKGPSFFAIKKHLIIPPKSSKTLVTSTGLVVGENDFDLALSKAHECDTKKELKQISNSFKKFASYLDIHSGDETFDSYVNNNLPFQVLYQTYVSRAFAQTQKGYREIGFREIQDLFASMPFFINNKQTKLVQSMLSKWISNVYEFGYANHNFFFVGKEPGMCSDDQIWLILAIEKYLELTNDYSFLKKRFVMANSNKKRSLYDTLKAIITYSGEISIGKHYLPLLDKADWNDCLKIDDDCLDGPTKEKLYKSQLRKNKQSFGVAFENELSESVMNAFLLDIALKDMIKISKVLDKKEDESHYNYLKDRLEQSLQENAYINGYFARVLINRKDSKYKYVGSLKDGLSIDPNIDGSIYLNSFSWSLLSNVASETQIKEMLPLVDKHLKTKAGYKLCTPHDLTRCGSKEAATEQYFLGDRENGGVFKHATMMFVVACLRKAKEVKDSSLKAKLLEDAEYMLNIVYPYNTLKNPYKFKGNPRFCTQYVNSLTEEHIGPILSGTSTWLVLALLEKYK